ncbi:BAD_collapsed_G0025930.mRNA.1.CDS.1 [Saccharomyces cerevisiae]|nr:BAD_collapsed_G0025930.mRNA.1.CDS.1 [Saccharomyces cerevisiae]
MGGKRQYGCWEALEKVEFSAFAFHDERWTAGSVYVKVQFSRHHRQLRSRYELSLGMHMRDQIGLGVTPSKVRIGRHSSLDADRAVLQ